MNADDAWLADLTARLDEAEEKLLFLSQGCTFLSREQLIQRITAVGSKRWQAGVYWAEREDRAFRRGVESVIIQHLPTKGGKRHPDHEKQARERIRQMTAEELENVSLFVVGTETVDREKGGGDSR